MIDGDEKKSDRRQWLRWAAATGLVGASAGLAARSFHAPADDCCPSSLPCRDCSVLADCRLPRAQQTRQEQTGKEDV
ncbi:MAG: hypothetical protein GXY83_43610 [Rhodopirellula sp.]|nr:hypothetical protein [Rhodopirellula sp.]